MVRSDMLRSGEVKSCGCLHDELFMDSVKNAYAKNFIENTSIPKLKSHKPQANNTSGVPSVSWNNRAKKWLARIQFQKKTYNLGYYDSIKDAEAARNVAKKALHGDFLEWYTANYKKDNK